MEEEIWKPVAGFEDKYSVSNLGRVRVEDHIDGNGNFHHQKIMKLSVTKAGYYHVAFHKNKITKSVDVHRLVAMTFLPNPNNYPVVNHKDENRLNNVIKIENGKIVDSNLEWCTYKYNSNYNDVNARRCIPIIQYSLSGEFIKEWRGVSFVSKALKKRACLITSCCRGRLHSAFGYIWRYKNSEYFDRPEGLVGKKGHQFKKPVLQFDMDMNLIKRFECAKDAEAETGVHNSKISLCCNGLRKSSGGYKWKFENQIKYAI